MKLPAERIEDNPHESQGHPAGVLALHTLALSARNSDMSNPLGQTADNVRAEMARQRLPQIALAKHLGLSQAAVSRRLNGQTAFDVDELVAVAALLNVAASSLLGEVAA